MTTPPKPTRIPVSRAVYVGLEAIRRSDLTNMLDRPRVADLADEMRFDEAAAWVRADRARYAQAVFNGIRPDDVPEGEGEPQPSLDPDPNHGSPGAHRPKRAGHCDPGNARARPARLPRGRCCWTQSGTAHVRDGQVESLMGMSPERYEAWPAHCAHNGSGDCGPGSRLAKM